MRGVDREQSYICMRIVAHFECCERFAIDRLHRESLSTVHDVAVGDDVAIGSKNETTARPDAMAW